NVQARTTATEGEESRRKRQEAQLRSRLANLESYLGSCDPELEQSYARQIKEVKAEVRALQQKPLPSPATIVDIERVRRFLGNLEGEWGKLSSALRNRLLKLLVERVEVIHDRDHIQATIIWKTGFKQRIDIERPVGNSRRDRHWTNEQDGLLRMLWPTSSKEVLLAALPGRPWGGIKTRAAKLALMRRVRHYPPQWKPWTSNDDSRLAALYLTQAPIDKIATELGRSTQAVMSRAWLLRVNRPKEVRFARPKLVWEVRSFDGLEAVCSWALPSPAA
ncbi:MAG: hypothetical protein Q8O40_14610, partial [Chloroflexota bacterium]|nr:hypothetical protein [Chloroflexota bacterium]